MRKIALILLIISMCAGLAQSQTVFPASIMIEGDSAFCFSMPQIKVVTAKDSTRKILEDKVEVQDEQLQNNAQAFVAFERMLDTQDKKVKALEKIIDEKDDQLDLSNEKFENEQRESRRQRRGKLIAWTSAGIIAVLGILF